MPPTPHGFRIGTVPRGRNCASLRLGWDTAFGLVDRGRIEANAETSRYHVAVVKQTTVRLPYDVAHDARAVARLQAQTSSSCSR